MATCSDSDVLALLGQEFANDNVWAARDAVRAGLPFSAFERIQEATGLHHEGRVNHLYLDTRGNVTVGVGHMVASRNAIANVTLYTTKNKLASKLATLTEKQAEYDAISKLSYGLSYTAASFKKHTTLIMSDSDIDAQRDKHLDSFHKELKALYTKAKGYPDDFGKLPRNVQLALFDMIFNLGSHKLSNSYPSFNKALKASDWKKAAKESKRNGIQDDRNQYVKKLLESVPAATGATP